MTMQIDPADEVSVETVNKKLEAFVEVILDKITKQQSEIKKLKTRVKLLEGSAGV